MDEPKSSLIVRCRSFPNPVRPRSYADLHSCVPEALILQASKVAHFNHATLFPAGQVTVPQLPIPKFEAEYVALGVAEITSPQLTG